MAKGKKLINDPNDVVKELIEGMVETYPHLTYLDGFPEVKVVLRSDIKRGSYNKVALISGGGSGHEPAHAGYVGEGMLTAAVCGDVFAAPSANAVLAGIRAVTGPAGCLLIVKNYTGDRLHFGSAAEQAKGEGYKVEMVIVGEDCALPPPPRGPVGRRGLAGTLFVHKVAGALAAAGRPLAEVAAEARRVAGLVGTMGVALTVCTVPGQNTSDRLGPGKMELGLGIHGEPGAMVADIQPIDVVVSHILKQILSQETKYVPIKRGSRVVLMVNSLGATPLMELMIAAGKAVAQLQIEHGLAVERVYTGSFMTSLDMAGMSLSVLKVDDPILNALDSPTKAPSWPVGVCGPRPSTTLPVALPPAPGSQKTDPVRPHDLSPQGLKLESAIRAGATAVLAMKDALNEWDLMVGDGDCGTTMATGAKAVLEDLDKHYPLNDAAATVHEIGCTIRKAIGGTSGIIYDIFTRAAYVVLKEGGSPATPKKWSAAFETAVAAVSKYGGASAGYRTLLDALIPASTTLKEKLASGEDPLKAFRDAAAAAEAGALATKSMTAQAGRSSYVPDHVLATVPDPGAMAAAQWLKAAAEALSPSPSP
jgi:dihydroxyacetone kinase